MKHKTVADFKKRSSFEFLNSLSSTESKGGVARSIEEMGALISTVALGASGAENGAVVTTNSGKAFLKTGAGATRLGACSAGAGGAASIVGSCGTCATCDSLTGGGASKNDVLVMETKVKIIEILEVGLQITNELFVHM